MASNPLQGIPQATLDRLAVALEAGSFEHGISAIALRREIPSLEAGVASRLTSLVSEGWSINQLRQLIEATRSAFRSGVRESHLFDLVMSGPEHPAVPMRDTNAVFQEMIAEATHRILIATYTIHNGSEILRPLSDRMSSTPDLDVALYLNIPRGRDNRTTPPQCVARFRQEFVNNHWPGDRLPSLFYFSPSIECDWRKRAAMHAKLIVIDQQRTFISSANLTRAAHTKNIEIGTIIEGTETASRLTKYFEGLKRQGEFNPLH